MIDDLFGALSLAVFERRAAGLFETVGQLPAWLAFAERRVDLSDRFPLLEVFFAECDESWEAESDVWTEPSPDGKEGAELYLQAVATTLADKRFLAIRSLPQAMFTYQQLAHDFELEKEKVERLSREVEIKRQEAERATQAKSDFLATMSHEIRTPLNAIIGMADVLSATQLSSEQQKCVDVFQRNGVGLLNLINDILDLSKVESGRVELEVTEMDVREVIARAMEVVEARATAKGLSLRQEIAPDVPVYLIGDPNRLRQIIINLLGNSIKFTDRGGLEVRVCLDPEDNRSGRLRFSINDTGIGIPADKLDLIFESFSQADSSTTRKYGGTGLGLAISKQLVELMGGRIWVESEVGVGSNFIFTAGFGVQADQTDRQALPVVQAPVEDLESQLAGLRILLADDSDDNRYLILSYLKRAQVSIHVAENGEEAARLFREGNYDVVLMDVEMPVMDGYQATAEIRRFEKEKATGPVPVLALTAHAFAEMEKRGMAAGFTALLTKPIRKVTLLEALMKYAPPEQQKIARQEVAGQAAAGQAQVTAHPILVHVEAGMEDVVPGYLAKRRAEIPFYTAALKREDYDSIKKMAHKMKGTGAGYGFPLLTELGAALEKAALEKDAPHLEDCTNQLALYLQAVELQYIK
jgi:signal transduction histidine kinase/DNA-binding NarL/FixJ family response regulator